MLRSILLFLQTTYSTLLRTENLCLSTTEGSHVSRRPEHLIIIQGLSMCLTHYIECYYYSPRAELDGSYGLPTGCWIVALGQMNTSGGIKHLQNR